MNFEEEADLKNRKKIEGKSKWVWSKSKHSTLEEKK